MMPSKLVQIYCQWLLPLLLRFRSFKFLITCDISQAFLQLVLAEEDRNVTKFLRFKTTKDRQGNVNLTDESLPYRFTRLPFGLAPSPFLLCASIKELARNHAKEYPISTKHLTESTYMDDFIMSEETEDRALILY
ncbi:hypothetical protein AVEN_65256-1 [Araneus ventricosus]|uniref:Reverse transcriptase domain-containing protein n=1 Tax=Araneus ventricosus TaxID=182803 RepID=A0A4Y2AGF0_ARAVE|nr:hypothetical protein AVEN_65256-1 [Araneus ventricosus]